MRDDIPIPEGGAAATETPAPIPPPEGASHGPLEDNQ